MKTTRRILQNKEKFSFNTLGEVANLGDNIDNVGQCCDNITL